MRQPMIRPSRLSPRGVGGLLLLGFLCTSTGCKLTRLGIFEHHTQIAPQSVPVDAESAPDQHHIRVSQYVFYTDRDLDQDAPLFQELSDLRDQVYRELRLPPSDTLIQVYLFEDQRRYEHYMSKWYPDLAKLRRRAFFIAQPRAMGGDEELLVFTYWSEHVREDLRHELTHALLHSTLPDVPLWLDEGLAEFFELAPEKRGVNLEYLQELQRESIPPDLARLERLRDVDQMRQPEYRESWAWVHWMLRGHPKANEVLLGYLRDLRTLPNPGELRFPLEQTVPDCSVQLTKHLSALESVTRHARR